MRNRKVIQFIISIMILMIGMTAGYILLALAYTGPGWKAFLVLIAYLMVSYFVIRYSIRYVRYLKEKDDTQSCYGYP